MHPNNLRLYLNVKNTINYIKDESFFRFMIDHKQYITRNSTLEFVSSVDKTKYKHSLKRYLRNKGIPNGLHWIVLMINNLKPNEDLSSKDTILLPNENVIKNLISQFNNIKSLKTKPIVFK